MRVLIVDFDFFTSVGGGQVFYRRVVERHPHIEFWYPSRGPDLTRKPGLPSNARPYALADIPVCASLTRVAPDFPDNNYAGLIWKLAVPLQGMHFDAVDIPAFFPGGAYLRPVLSSLGIAVDRLCMALLGWLSVGMANGFASDWNDEVFARLTALERAAAGCADIRYTISELHVAESLTIGLPVKVVDMDDVLEEFALPPRVPPGEGPPDIWYIGRLDGNKGPDLFIQMASRVPSDLYRHCYIAGPDNEWSDTERWSDQVMNAAYRLGVRATYLGCPSDTEIRARAYAGRSVVIIPSRSDVFNYVAVEALRSGCPILLSSKAGSAGFLARKHPHLVPSLIDVTDLGDAGGKLLDILLHYDEGARRLRGLLHEHPFPAPRKGFMDPIYCSPPHTDRYAIWRAKAQVRAIRSELPLLEPAVLQSRQSRKATSEPRVSVIIPTYQRPALLAPTLAALSRQTVPNFEIIVIDDGSTNGDLVRTVVESVAPVARYVRQENSGEARAVNRGIREARGEFIGVLSDDDLYAPTLLDRAVDTLDKHHAAIAAYPDWDIVDELGQTIEEHRLPAFDRNMLICWQWCLPGPGTIVRKSALDKAGGRDPSFRFISDLDMWVRVTRCGDMVHIPEKLAYWRLHDTNLTTDINRIDMAAERLRFAKKILSDSDEPLHSPAIRSEMAAAAHLAAAAILGRKNPIRAGLNLFRAAQLSPDLASRLAPNMTGYPAVWPKWHDAAIALGRMARFGPA
jgi:glycosyltransferase involved in cell wall biosynthesis